MAELDLFGKTSHTIHAVVFAGRIAVIYPNGMSFFDAACNEWNKKAGIREHESGAECDLYVWEDILEAHYAYACENDSVECRSEYSAPLNKWTRASV